MSGARIARATPAEHFSEARTDDRSVKNAPHGMQVVQVETLGKHGVLLLLIASFAMAASAIGLYVLYDAHRVTRQHVKILEYDLMDLRAKTGHAHENTEEK